MSYFNDFAAGYQMTSGARERNRDRQDKIDQEKLRREFELDKDVERYRQDDIARRAGYDNQTNQRVGAADAAREAAERGYEFTGGEGEKGRTASTTQAQLERDAREVADRRKQKQTNRQFNEGVRQFDITNQTQNAANLTRNGLAAAEQMRKDDPNSLANQKLNEQVEKLKRENASSGPLPGGKDAPAVNLTPKDREALTWARANPYDAQATKILDRLKLAK
jgi:DNA polymerase III epsilon subunit-like protein